MKDLIWHAGISVGIGALISNSCYGTAASFFCFWVFMLLEDIGDK